MLRSILLRILGISALLLVISAAGAGAQEQPRLEPGARIRVSAPQRDRGIVARHTTGWVVGTLRETTPTALVVQTDPADPASSVEIPFDVIRGLQVSAGETDPRESTVRGAKRGALFGAGAAVVYVGFLKVLANHRCTFDEGGQLDPCYESNPLFSTEGSAIARDVVVGVAGGAAIGALFGSSAGSRERWVGVRRPRVGVAPATGGGTRISLSFGV